MTHVHYKFSSKLSYDTVVFDGPHITLRDLKRQIMGREKLRAGDCDLQITDAQSKEEYTDDEGLISKGSSVIIRRIPIIGAKSSSSSKIRNVERSDVQLPHAFGAFKAMDDQHSSGALPFISKMANLAEADVSEEDKLSVVINQSNYDSMNYNKKFGTQLPSSYTCYRCGNIGHHIRNCPNSGDKNNEPPVRIKKSTGIPRSFMVEVDDPNMKGAMLTNCGRYAIPAIDAEAYAIGKKERPPFVPQEQPKSEEEEDPLPEELLCLICHDLLNDAVLIPCCGNSYCDDCIRTTLLDSEEHVCPTCSQSEVSPDSLIANKFLRQAVDNFKKERGYTKTRKRGCGTSQSQNPTPTLSPAPTPPPLAVQSQPQKPHLPTSSQQDPLMPRSQAADSPPLSQVCVAPPTATEPASAPNTPSTSLQPTQSHLEIPDREADEKTHDDSAASAAPSGPVSPKDPTDAPSQLIPLVNLTPEAEQPQTDSVNLQQPSSGPALKPSVPPTTWESSSSSSRPAESWNETNTQQQQQRPPPSISYPTAPPPLFPSPHFHTFLTAQQPLSSYPPGYPPAAPVWTLPNLQGAPIPSLCPSTSIPALIPKEWYRHQRKKKERSPHRGSSHKSSSSRSNSKSSKSKSSRSYSRSSSRSRSRSRSKGRSRPHSTYSRHRHLHTHSHSSRSYTYGYKRSPTPSSSSSSRAGYHSRSKSPSDDHKNSHQSRHHSKKSASSSYRKRGEHSHREAGGSGGSAATYPYSQHVNQASSLELDRERYLQWKREYKEWCDKYFSSYVGHFHQLPLPLLSLPPPPQWGERDEGRNHSHSNSDSHNRLQGRRAARNGRSPPSQSSSDSRSPPSQSSRDHQSTPSQSSCDSRSTPSQSSSDSRSSPSHSSNDSRSPPSQSSSDGRSTPCEDRAQPRALQQRCTEKYSCLPATLAKGSKEVQLQEGSKDGQQLVAKNLENLSTLKNEQTSIKKHEEHRREKSSSPDSTDDCRKNKRKLNTEPDACKDGSPARDKSTASDALKSAQALVKPHKRLDKDCERKSREQRNLESEKGRPRGKHSDFRHDVERQHREKPREEAGRDRHPGGRRASDSGSEKKRKRKGEERSSDKAQSSKCLKTEIAEDPETCKSESPNPFERSRPKPEKKKERKTLPLTETDIWEGGIKVKPQKKISININLDGKKKEEKTEKRDLSYLESLTGKTKEESETADKEDGEKLNRGETNIEGNEKKESSRDIEGASEEKTKPDQREAQQKWAKATFRDDMQEMLEKIAGEKEDTEEKKEDFDLWHSILREVEEKKESINQWEEGEPVEASKGEEVAKDERRSMWGGKEGQEMAELVAGTWKERAEGEITCEENRGNLFGESKPKEELMEGLRWRMRKEEDDDAMRSKSQWSRNESHDDRPDTTVDDGSSYEDHQERKTVVKTLEEYTQDSTADGQDELVLIQVPRSKWEKEESEEEERDEGEIKDQIDALAMFMPPPSVSVTAEVPTNRETESEEKTERSVEMQRGRDREKEKNPSLTSSHRSLAPSSGRDQTDLSTDRDREKRVGVERRRDRDRGRESERSWDRQKESKRSKERTREEERRRDRRKERDSPKRNHPSSSHSYSYSMSHDSERRDRQRGGDPGGCPGVKSSSSRANELPDHDTNKSHRDTLMDSKFKDKDQPYYYHIHQDLSGNRPAGTHHSPPSLSHSQRKERDLLPSGSELSKPRMSSPEWETVQNRFRDDSKVEKAEWKLQQVIKEVKRERERGSRREDDTVELDRQTRQEGGRELEEGERPSSRSNSVSSSASQENDRDDRRKEKKTTQKKHKKEKRRASPELLEEGELKKHKHKKTAKKSRDESEEESSGKADGRWREEDDRTKLCSVTLP
ncbi:E3 ubiquitin-protein ligase RBBP6-like isoform X3 [Epinephelus moara]|uniref:E3 ubiquitin-protein ligase RBBP6-like isoform X3 n=1 Tax=Epinephelus moara TaxID=300413 RepID=UPI00214F4045|nr:E3 ubiquitin-protein ligase RBBP6-like isoform X3 [Epinephelus moara]